MLGRSRDKPLLAVDIDGVISLFGFDASQGDPPGEFHLIDGMAHCISREAGDRLGRLRRDFDLVWASGWEDRANDNLPSILGLPQLPYLTFDGKARFGSAHWKLSAIDEYAGDRPLAWIDDSFDRSCYKWERKRAAPTLLVPTESDRGLEEAHCETLVSWARAGFEPE